jgi:hypothetical protein
MFPVSALVPWWYFMGQHHIFVAFIFPLIVPFDAINSGAKAT